MCVAGCSTVVGGAWRWSVINSVRRNINKTLHTKQKNGILLYVHPHGCISYVSDASAGVMYGKGRENAGSPRVG